MEGLLLQLSTEGLITSAIITELPMEGANNPLVM